MAWRDDVTLHRQTVLHQLAERNLGEPPEILVGDEVWLPPEAKQRLAEAVREDLAEHRVLLPGGRLREDFHDLLALIVAPATGIFGWIQSEEYGNYAVAVVRSGRDAVVVLRRGEWVRFMPAEPDTVVTGWIDQIPFWEAGAGNTLNLPEADAPWVVGDGNRPGVRVTPECRRLKAILELPRYGGGQIHAVIGKRHAKPALTYLDTEQGRWLISFDREQPRDRWVTATPATQQAFVSQIESLINRVR